MGAAMKVSLLSTIKSWIDSNPDNNKTNKTNVTSTALRSMSTGPSQLTGLVEIKKPNKLRKLPPQARPPRDVQNDATVTARRKPNKLQEPRPQAFIFGNSSNDSFGCVDGMKRVQGPKFSLSNKPALLSPEAFENPRQAPLPPGASSQSSAALINSQSHSSGFNSLFDLYGNRSHTDSLTSGSNYSQNSVDDFVLETKATPKTTFKKETAPPQFFSQKRVHAHREKILNELKDKMRQDE
jgi:hypothetical protein